MNRMIDENELEERVAIQKGADALRQLRTVLDRAARDLAQYEAQYAQAETLMDRSRVLNWALFHVTTSVMPNARLDLAANAQAELHALDKRKAKT